MYDTLFTKIEPHKFHDLEALQESLAKRPDYTTELVDPVKVSLNDDGLINWNGSSARMSLQGFRHMMVNLYKIPDPFAKWIPLDLLQHNIKEIGQNLDFNMTFVFNHEGLLVNAVKDNLMVLPSLPLLDTIKDFQVKHIECSDVGLNVQVVNPAFKDNAEPKQGDVTAIGVNFLNSETGFTSPKAENLLWTLACSNGAIVSRRFGLVKLKIKAEDPSTEGLVRTFSRRMDELIEHGNNLVTRLNGFSGMPMSNKNAAWILKALSRVIGKDEALGAFNLESEDFTRIKDSARSETEKDKSTNLDTWDVYSKVTNIANDYHSDTRRKLQLLGGKFLELDQIGGRLSLN